MDPIQTDLKKRSAASKSEKKGQYLTFLCIGISVLIIVALIFFITYKGLLLFLQDKVSILSFLSGISWDPNNGNFGALSMLLGSMFVTILAVFLAFPFSFGTAIFISEIKFSRGSNYLRLAIEMLIGIPAVVYGFVGISVVVPLLRVTMGGTGFGLLAGAVILAMMILPTISTLCVDAFKGVPEMYRYTSRALGATQWQTLRRIVLPIAKPRIVTAILFGMSQAFGEAVAIQMVIGNATLIPTHLMSPAATLTSVITIGMGDSVRGSIENDALWSLALLLLLISLLFNLVARFVMRKRN
ncbi:phosphate ABC transporter permease subunit PstC [Liquorilactobacillus uvarum]|uniref:phosphate ABC transporter permease subunit PstC n=1 Tax=Liquorilactobacillus uvarum TaxID=303240 RepID=UPI00288B64DB|nr:phosphate ABC transporter permease subunit PstC [Liquorilactobacillus uvarum]